MGAIMLNPALDKCLLVKSWGSNGAWGFPRGKISKDEADADCARREVRASLRTKYTNWKTITRPTPDARAAGAAFVCGFQYMPSSAHGKPGCAL